MNRPTLLLLALAAGVFLIAAIPAPPSETKQKTVQKPAPDAPLQPHELKAKTQPETLPEKKSETQPETLPEGKSIRFVEYDLPNGLHVILHEEHTAPVVSSYVLYHVGSKNERPDRTGFAHFFEHLMFEGTDYIKRGQIDKLVSGAGGNLNASTSFDQTDYYLNLPANQLELALWIESERMLHAKIDEAGVETQRQVVKEERKLRIENRPYGTLLENLARLVFAGTPYEWTPIGSAQYIDQATIDEFRAFYKTYYVPNNATLSIAGDIDIEKTKKLIEGYFAPIPKGADVPRPAVSIASQTAPKTEAVRKDNTPLPASLHAWRIPEQTHPDAYAMELLTTILSGGRSSRLYQRLVDKEQAAIQASAFPFSLEKAGMIGVFAIGNSGVGVEKLDQLIDEELERVRAEGVTAEEYQKAMNQKEAELASSFGSAAARARSLAGYHVFYGNTNLINTELQSYLKVTQADLKRVANTYLTKAGRSLLHYPAPDAKK